MRHGACPIRVHRRSSAAIVLLLASAALAQSGASPLPGQIVVDADHPAWFKRHGGSNFFMCGPGDPEDFLYRGTLRHDGTRDGDQQAIIEKLRGTGANCLYIQVVRSHGGDGDRTHNPFVSHDPGKGVHEAVLEQWESWFTQLDQMGVVIFLFIYDDNARIWKTGDRIEEAERQFLRTIVDRFEHHRHLVWCIAEEYSEKFTPGNVTAMAAEIRQADDHDHPIAVHKLHGVEFAEFADDPNIDQFAVQYNVAGPAQVHEGMVKAWHDARGRGRDSGGPASGGYNLNMSEMKDHGTGRTARLNSWAAAMGGAYVMVLGMDGATTATEDLKDCGRLVAFFEATDFQTMSPHDELAHGEAKYVLANPGPRKSWIVYAPGGSGALGIKDAPAGRLTLRWFDCVSGTWVVEHVESRGGEVSWKRPAHIGEEAALWITRD